jgi:hypothetical protein
LENVVEVEDLGDMQDGFHDKEIYSEMCYTLDDHAKFSIERFGSDFDNDEGSEKETKTRYDDRKNDEILERNLEQWEEANKQQREDGLDEGYVEIGVCVIQIL